MWCFMTVSGILNCNCCNTVVCETNFLSPISQNGTLYGSQIDLSITWICRQICIILVSFQRKMNALSKRVKSIIETFWRVGSQFFIWCRSKCNIFSLLTYWKLTQSSYAKKGNCADNVIPSTQIYNFDTLRQPTFIAFSCFWMSDKTFLHRDRQVSQWFYVLNKIHSFFIRWLFCIFRVPSKKKKWIVPIDAACFPW